MLNKFVQRLKKIGKFIFAFLLIVIGLEVGSYIVLKWKSVPTSNYQQVYLSYQGLPPDKRDKPLHKAQEPHPFFGYVFSKGNNYGFNEEVDFPYPNRKGEFVIGIFGGSTAMHWAEWMKKNNFFSTSHPNIVILNFALSGMKQPQQFHIASHFIENLDLALSLDGWNEALKFPCPDQPELPQNYRLLLAAQAADEDVENLIKIKRKLEGFSGNLADSRLRSSHFIHFIWQTGVYYYTQKRLNLDLKYRSNRDKQYSLCENPKIEDNFKIWKKFSLLTHHLAELYKVPYIHLMQPAPYLKESKKLDTEEKLITKYDLQLRPGWLGHRYRQFYSLYLESRPDFSEDWTRIFKNTEQQIYIDSFTHFNDEGYRIASEKLKNLLSGKGLVNSSPPE